MCRAANISHNDRECITHCHIYGHPFRYHLLECERYLRYPTRFYPSYSAPLYWHSNSDESQMFAGHVVGMLST